VMMGKRTKKERLHVLGGKILAQSRKKSERGLFDAVDEPFEMDICKRVAVEREEIPDVGVNLEWGTGREPILVPSCDVSVCNTAESLGVRFDTCQAFASDPDNICSVLGLYQGVHQLSQTWTQRHSFYDPVSSVLQALSPADGLRFVLGAGVQGFLGAHFTFGSFLYRFGKEAFSWKGSDLGGLVYWLGEYVKDFPLLSMPSSFSSNLGRLRELSVPDVLNDIVYRLQRDCGFSYLRGDRVRVEPFGYGRVNGEVLVDQGKRYMQSVQRFFWKHRYKHLDAPF